MKCNVKIKLKILILSYVLALFSCNESSKAENTILGTGAEPMSSQITIPTSLPVGTEIVFNPKISVTGTSICEYDNSTFSSSELPLTVGPVECNMTFSQSGDNLDVTLINFDLFGSDDLILSMASFVDKGNDGFIDQFSVAAVNGAKSVIGTGQFIGSYKPKNTSFSDTQVKDVSNAPSITEWNTYIVKNMIFLEQPKSKDSFALIQFLDQSNAQYAKDGISESTSYIYNKKNKTDGTLSFPSWTGTNGVTVDVIFDTFYHGTWRADWKDSDDGKEENASGIFNMYTDNSLAF